VGGRRADGVTIATNKLDADVDAASAAPARCRNASPNTPRVSWAAKVRRAVAGRGSQRANGSQAHDRGCGVDVDVSADR
jgi:hypothetical protein